MKKQLNYSKLLLETVILTVAVAIIAAAVYFFLVPSHTSVSSISGLGIVLSNFVPLPLSAITMILNVVLLIIGFFTCGKEFGVKTVYTSIMLPLFLGLFEKIFPDFGSMTNSQELDVLCYILVVSVGLSILFNRNASSGGSGHRGKDHEQISAYGTGQGHVTFRHVRGTFCRTWFMTRRLLF